ncbi:hypothetical protein AYL99_02828 [Fonsecaea erecta]|uniref:Transcription factor domain-containing protein n=1 Tax=Fonsecaea erecta TaxID=1367422 RepID=A0A178ZVX0_9EURO|nr:hypothetical protein AYL99_02828 [Fonsecaea erecta]OAP63601.1 hypothetical protein AYL99_02828 [Fonsecaea erecta]
MASGHQRDNIRHIIIPLEQTSTNDPATTTTATCGVCRRPQCQLHSHRAYLAHRSRRGASSATTTTTTTNQTIDRLNRLKESRQHRPKLLETSYARSYAYTRTPPTLGAGRLDGFHDLPVTGGHRVDLHQSVYNLLHSKIGAATAFPLPTGLAVNDIGGSMIIPVLTDRSLCLSVIAAWKAVQFLMGHIPAFAHLAYETQALQSLRQTLLLDHHHHDGSDTPAVTDEAILAAALLWATAAMFAQPDALHRHAAGVRALVAARGGLSAIGGGGGRVGSIGQAGSIRQMILWADFLTAQFLGEDVIFRDTDDPPPPLPASLAKVARSITVPVAFDTLSPETLRAVRDMKLLLVSHDSATRTGRVSIAEYKALMALLNKSTIDRLGLAYRLRGSHSLDETVVLAMNLLRLTVLFHAGPLVAIVVAATARLRKALAHTTMLDAPFLHGGGSHGNTGDTKRNPHSGNRIDVYTWACFVGLTTPFDSEDRTHFVAMLRAALALRYRNKDKGRDKGRDTGWPDDWQQDTLEMLRSFLWSDAVLTPLYPTACRMVDGHLVSSTGGGTDAEGDTGQERWSHAAPDKVSRAGVR